MNLIYLNALQNHFYDKPRTLIAILKKHDFDPKKTYQREVIKKTRDPEADYAHLQDLGIEILSITDEAYPTNLKNTSCPPAVIYYKGSLDCLRNPCVAIVGTRKISSYGRRSVSAIIDVLSQYKITMVSGLAYGIDTEAHTKSVKKNMSNIAVLANGLDQIYPTENIRLAERIATEGGIVMSESPPGVPSQKFMFPIRNRIIAGLADATIVVEAPGRSGALITADYAFSENRLVYAVPGEFDSYRQEGCHKLIKSQKAVLLDDPKQVIDDITPTRLKLEFARENDVLQALIDAVEREPTSLTAISNKLKKQPQELLKDLLELELAGKVKNVGGMCYVRR